MEAKADRRPSRVNVEAEVTLDPRYQALEEKVGRFVAMGMLVHFWRSAQIFFKRGQPMPREVFEIGGFGPLLAVGLAKECEGGVRAAGQAEQFGWLQAKADAGKRSGESRRNKREQKRTNANETEPPTPPPTPIYKEECAAPQAPHSSAAIAAPAPTAPAQELCGVENFSLTNPADTSVLDPRAARKKAKALARQRAVASYCEAFKRRYGIRPPLGGKEIGTLGRVRDRIGSDQGFSDCVQAFLQMEGDRGWFTRRRHDVATLETCLNEIAIAIARGDPDAGGFDWEGFWGSVNAEGDGGSNTLRKAVEATS